MVDPTLILLFPRVSGMIRGYAGVEIPKEFVADRLIETGDYGPLLEKFIDGQSERMPGPRSRPPSTSDSG